MLAASAAALVLLAACGQKGPLVLPGHSKDTPWPLRQDIPAPVVADPTAEPTEPASAAPASTSAPASGSAPGSTALPAPAAATAAPAPAKPGQDVNAAAPNSGDSAEFANKADKPAPVAP